MGRLARILWFVEDAPEYPRLIGGLYSAFKILPFHALPPGNGDSGFS